MNLQWVSNRGFLCVFHRLEWTRVDSSARRWGPMRTSGFSRTWRKRSQSSLQWCGRTCSVHAVSILWVFLLTPPRISWALTQKVCLFSMNGARRSKCSLWRIPVPLVFARPLQEFVKAGKKLITEGDLEAEFRAQCTPQPNGSEWIATQTMVRLVRDQADYFYIVQEGKFEISVREEGSAAESVFALLLSIAFRFPFSAPYPSPTHTGLLNQMFAEQVELSRILGYTMIHLPVPSCANVMVRRCSKILEIPCGNRIGYRGRRSWRAQQTLSCRAHCLGADVTTENPCDIMQLYAIISSTLKHFDDVFLCFSAIFHYVIMFTVHLLWDSECSEVVGHSKKGEAWRLELTFDELILTALGLVTRHATFEK